MAFSDGGIIGLDLLEIPKLIQPLNTELPILFVIKLSLLQHQFAPDDRVTGSRVPGKLDPANRKLLAFIHVNIKRYLLFLFVKAGSWDGGEVDLSTAALNVLQIFKSFGALLTMQTFTIFG